MILLIGGNSCTGKTLMSQKLLEKYKTPYFSIDHLKMGLYRSNPNCGFTPLDDNLLIAEKLWPIVKEMVKTAIENDQNMIIEGCYLFPDMVKELEGAYLNKIISVFLGFSSQYIMDNFESSIIKHSGVIESRGPEERPISQFLSEHDDFRRRCMTTDVNYFEINQDYQKEIIDVYNFIDAEIKSRELLKNS